MPKNDRNKTNSQQQSRINPPKPATEKSKSQIKRMKKKRAKNFNQNLLHEIVEPTETWETCEELSIIPKEVAALSDESVQVSEVLVLSDNASLKTFMNAEEEETLRKFLNTLDIPVSKDDSLHRSRIDVTPVINIPEEIFKDFIHTEEMKRTKEAIKSLAATPKSSPKSSPKFGSTPKLSPKASPKSKRKDQNVTKCVTKMIEPPSKTLYSYSGVPISSPGIVTIDELDDRVFVVHCHEDLGFEPMDIIVEECSSELSDSCSDKKRYSLDSEVIHGTVKITEPPQNLPEVVICENLAESRDHGVEIVLLDDETDSNHSALGKDYLDLKFIDEGSEISSYAADDYEADVESAVDSKRGTVIMDSPVESEDERQFSRQTSTGSSVNTAKYLPPYSRSESEPDDWKSLWVSEDITQEIKEVAKNVNVVQLKKNLENDMVPILMSKLSIMQVVDDPTLHEKTWNKVLENTRKTLNKSTSFVNKEVQTVRNPPSLSFLAKEVLLSMPNGIFLSQKIGISLSCPTSPSEVPLNRRFSDTETCSELLFYNTLPSSYDETSVVEFSIPDSGVEDNKWYGMPTGDPSLYLGLSPSQMQTFSSKHSLPSKDTAECLLDLHQKFVERRSYSENTLLGRNVVFDSAKDLTKDEVTHVIVGEVGGSKRKQASVDSTIKSKASKSDAVAKTCTLAPIQNGIAHDQARLKVSGSGVHEGWAMDVGHKQASECWTEAGGVGRTILDRFMNNGESTQVSDSQPPSGNRPDSSGVASDQNIVTERLPSVGDIIKAFETPAESPLKNKKEPNIDDSKSNFISENYVISKNRDIALIDTRRKSLNQDEVFKQQMYDEYMSKLAERIERRHQNSIKISNQTGDTTDFKPQGVEEEFINKVREKLSKSSDEDWRREEAAETQSSKRSSVVLGGEGDLSGLPKHLQEFFSIDHSEQPLEFGECKLICFLT